MTPTSGIYKIAIGRTYYYGQSSDLRKREIMHRYQLRKGNHHNTQLQRAYDAHPEEYAFIVRERCAVEELDEREQAYLDAYWGDDRCANASPCSDHPVRGVPRSAETKAKISESNRGKVRSAETRRRISAARTGSKDSDSTRETKRQAALRRAPITEETRAKLSKPVNVEYLDGSTATFPSGKAFGDTIGVNKALVSLWATGRSGSHKNYGVTRVWR